MGHSLAIVGDRDAEEPSLGPDYEKKYTQEAGQSGGRSTQLDQKHKMKHRKDACARTWLWRHLPPELPWLAFLGTDPPCQPVNPAERRDLQLVVQGVATASGQGTSQSTRPASAHRSCRSRRFALLLALCLFAEKERNQPSVTPVVSEATDEENELRSRVATPPPLREGRPHLILWLPVQPVVDALPVRQPRHFRVLLRAQLLTESQSERAECVRTRTEQASTLPCSL